MITIKVPVMSGQREGRYFKIDHVLTYTTARVPEKNDPDDEAYEIRDLLGVPMHELEKAFRKAYKNLEIQL